MHRKEKRGEGRQKGREKNRKQDQTRPEAKQSGVRSRSRGDADGHCRVALKGRFGISCLEQKPALEAEPLWNILHLPRDASDSGNYSFLRGPGLARLPGLLSIWPGAGRRRGRARRHTAPGAASCPAPGRASPPQTVTARTCVFRVCLLLISSSGQFWPRRERYQLAGARPAGAEWWA